MTKTQVKETAIAMFLAAGMGFILALTYILRTGGF